MPLSSDDLLARLEALGIAATTIRHPPLFTVAQSQALRGEIDGAHTKNLFLKDKKDRLWLVVAPEDADVDMKRLHARIGSARLSFGRPELLVETLGVEPGSVTPFGVVNDADARVTVVLDEALMAYETLNFHPLTNEATTSIARDDLVRFLEACGHPPHIVAVSGD